MGRRGKTRPRGRFLWGLILALALLPPAAGVAGAAGSKTCSPAEMLAAAQAQARRRDPQARLVLAAYGQGGLQGGFQTATLVYHSPRLAGQRWNCYQVLVRGGEVRHVGRVRMPRPQGRIPDSSPGAALCLARSWILAHWWRGQKDAYLDLILRPRRPKEPLPYPVRWVWEARAIAQEEECTVYLDAVKMRCLRAVIKKAPDATPPPAEHFKEY